MKANSLLTSLGPLVEETGCGGQRMQQVFNDHDVVEAKIYAAWLEASTDDFKQKCWRELERCWSEQNKKMDAMAKWLEASNERTIGAFFQAKDDSSSSS